MEISTGLEAGYSPNVRATCASILGEPDFGAQFNALTKLNPAQIWKLQEWLISRGKLTLDKGGVTFISNSGQSVTVSLNGSKHGAALAACVTVVAEKNLA